MATRVSLESTSSRRIPVSGLDPLAFARFGQVIQNPSTHDGQPRVETVAANQGSATKYLDVTILADYYGQSHSRRAGKPVMNMFVCQPRDLHNAGADNGGRLFDVKILERHPFTPQTFIPLGLDKHDRNTYYLVIVAPTLPLRSRSERSTSASPPYPTPPPRAKRDVKEKLRRGRPNPFTNDFAPRTTGPKPDSSNAALPKGPGLPDLDNLQAFIARGDQAVTYGPGTWHAPMVVLGERPIDFVVVQLANGVGSEDCQEVEIVPSKGSGGIQVAVDQVRDKSSSPVTKSKL